MTHAAIVAGSSPGSTSTRATWLTSTATRFLPFGSGWRGSYPGGARSCAVGPPRAAGAPAGAGAAESGLWAEKLAAGAGSGPADVQEGGLDGGGERGGRLGGAAAGAGGDAVLAGV